MSRLKRGSSLVVEMAAKRLAGLESIGLDLDLGNGLTVPAFKTALSDAQSKLAGYNTLLSQVDEASNVYQVAEDKVRDLSERMLAGVAARFGRDSDQYEMAGGTRKSERRRSSVKAPVPPAP